MTAPAAAGRPGRGQPHRALLSLLAIFIESGHSRRLLWAFAVFALIHAAGTAGFLWIGGATTSPVDALYMTFITVSTIGFSEVIDLTDHPGGRLFTIAIALLGIGTMTFLFSTVTAFVLETNQNRSYRRRRVQDRIARLNDHYVVCGAGRIGGYVIDELEASGLAWVAIDNSVAAIEQIHERRPTALWVEGDAADDDTLERAGIARCRGVFAVTGDDSKNLVVSLSAKQLNPAARVVARVHDPRNVAKTLRAGADEIVSPDFSGGRRIAALMLRPQMVSLVDELLRAGGPLSVEELAVPAGSRRLTVAGLGRSTEWLLVAIREGERWAFNPPDDALIAEASVLIVIASETGRRELERALAG
jgi:voltage-gated potassium channel